MSEQNINKTSIQLALDPLNPHWETSALIQWFSYTCSLHYLTRQPWQFKQWVNMKKETSHQSCAGCAKALHAASVGLLPVLCFKLWLKSDPASPPDSSLTQPAWSGLVFNSKRPEHHRCVKAWTETSWNVQQPCLWPHVAATRNTFPFVVVSADGILVLQRKARRL